MNLSDLILLNFLAWIRISATINPHKVEVSNINGITKNCSDKVKVKLTYFEFLNRNCEPHSNDLAKQYDSEYIVFFYFSLRSLWVVL